MGDTDVNETVDTPPVVLPVLSRTWTRAPFFVLAAAWVGLVFALTYLLLTSAVGSPVESPYYPYVVFGGATLTFLGFVTGLVVWLLARSRATDDDRGKLGRTVWVRALGTTAAGVALWWIGLLALDLQRILR